MMSKSKKTKKISESSILIPSPEEDSFYQKFGFFDPKFDIVFKFIFGRKSSAHLLTMFLNDLCEYFRIDPIVSLEILDPFNIKQFKEDKLSIVDIKAKTASGIYINVEIQKARNHFYVARSHYYADHLYIYQLKEKENYSTLKKVICLHILDFVLFEDEPDMLNTFRFKNIRSGKELMPVMKELNYLELPKAGSFLESAKEWKELFNPSSKESLLKLCKRKEAIMLAVDELNHFSMDPEARKIYFNRRKAEMDRQSILETAEKIGEARGEAKGKARTLQVIKLFQKGHTYEKIAEEIKCTLAEVESILKEFKD